jgi:hypothetical protein
MSSIHDRDHPSDEAVSRDLQGDPVPLMMLTLPTPEIPAAPFLAPQSLFVVPEFPMANSNIPGTSSHSNRKLNSNQETGFEEPPATDGKPNAECGISSDLLNVPAWNAMIGVRSHLDEVLEDEENVESRKALLGALDVNMRLGESDGCQEDDPEVPMDNTELKAEGGRRISLWTRFRKFFELPSRRGLPGSAAATDVPRPRKITDSPSGDAFRYCL